MAVTISAYNQLRSLVLGQDITLSMLKVMLLDATASFVAANTTIDDVAGALAGSPLERAKEVYGYGWDQGGELLLNVAASIVSTSQAKLDADDIDVTATGGDIGPTSAAVIYDDASNSVLAYVDFGTSKTADVGTSFIFSLNAAGLITLT